MKVEGIQERLTQDYYEMCRVPMGGEQVRDWFITIAYSIGNMVRLLDPNISKQILDIIKEEVNDYNRAMEQEPEGLDEADDEFDEQQVRLAYVAKLDNTLKTVLCEAIGEKLEGIVM